MRCAPSEVTSITSTAPSWGDRSYPLPERGDPSCQKSPQRAVKKLIQIRTYSAQPERGSFAHPAHSLQNSREQSDQGKVYRRILCYVCTLVFSPRGARWVRENQSGQCNVSRHWQWVTSLLSLSWLSWGSTRTEQGTIVPTSWSNHTPSRDKWSSVMEKAHLSWHLILTPSSCLRFTRAQPLVRLGMLVKAPSKESPPKAKHTQWQTLS